MQTRTKGAGMRTELFDPEWHDTLEKLHANKDRKPPNRDPIVDISGIRGQKQRGWSDWVCSCHQ
jgi:hypothetical protein